MGKWCLLASSFIFYQIIIKNGGNQDRHKSLVKFDFGLNQTTNFGVTCPRVTKISHFWTWISLKPVGQSWSNFMCSIIGVSERLHKVLGQVGSKLWFPWYHWVGERLHYVLKQIGSKLWLPWQQKAPIDLQWGKWCLHLFSVVFDPILFILAGNEDMHKILDKFEFRPDWTTDYRVSCLWGLKYFP